MRQREAKISDAIREAIATLPGVILWRNSPALARVRGGRAWCGLPRGSADLVGIVRTRFAGADVGRFFALEVKAPGEIPLPEDIDLILEGTISPVVGAAMRNARLSEVVWRNKLASLHETKRHVIEQEAWLDDVRSLGGFAAYVDCPEAGVRAVEIARDLSGVRGRYRVVTAKDI